MIDPTRITNFHRDEAEAQGFLLFCIAVAGKNADLVARSVNRLLAELVRPSMPVFWFYWLHPDLLDEHLRIVRIGQYGRIHRAIMEVAEYLHDDKSVASLSLNELLGVFGIGPKTARFFILHSRPGAKVAVLDTHVLSWLRDRGYDVPETATPQNPARYERLERAWLVEAATVFHGKSPAEADLLIWLLKSGRLQE